MRHLTTAESPQLNRNSKVLSWISESEDILFEDTGTGSGEEQGGELEQKKKFWDVATP